jgi:hypothetical protein
MANSHGIIDVCHASTFCSKKSPSLAKILSDFAVIKPKRKGDFMQTYFVWLSEPLVSRMSNLKLEIAVKADFYMLFLLQ